MTRVVIAGGGVAAVEALLALSDAARSRTEITLLSPEPELELRALTVATPFAEGHERRRFPLAPLTEECGATLMGDGLASVDTEGRAVITTSGERVEFDALVVAVGARPRPAFTGVITFGAEPLALNGLLADLEEGYTRKLAFVVPYGVCWPLPAYELALMTRRQARSMGMDPEIAIVTPESSPLAIFGRSASARLAGLLEDAGIEVRLGENTTTRPDAERVVALPLLDGPRIEGLEHDQNGFVPIDEFTQVLDVPGVYCVGDAANYPIKQGGLATQQADTAAWHIAAQAGARLDPKPFRPILRGRLFTGGAEQFFVKEVGRPAGRLGEVPLWWPPTKVSGRYLTPWIAGLDPEAVPPEPEDEAEAVEIEVPADPTAARRAALSLSPLGEAPPVRR